MKSQTNRYLLIALLYIFFSWAGAYYSIWQPEHATINMASLISGRSDLPFQYRILGVWAINAMHKTFGIAVRRAEFIFYMLAYFATFWALRWWLLNFFSETVANLSPFWLLPLVVNNLIFRYPWDAVTLFAFPLMFALLLKRKWLWLFLAFIVFSFNRETTYLLIPSVVLVWYIDRKPELKRVIAFLFLLIVCWIGVKFLLFNIYASSGNKGGLIEELKLGVNWALVSGKISSPDFDFITALRGFHFPLGWLTFLSFANFFWLFMFFGWRKKPVVLKALFPLIPLHFATVLFLGNLWERRVYLETYPIVIALGLKTFFNDERTL